MAERLDEVMVRCLQLLMRPVARFCLKRSLGLQDIIEAAKVTLVELAEEELHATEKKVNLSRISIATGVHRKDAARIRKHGIVRTSSQSFSTRIIAQWRQDPDFQTSSGKPRVLTFGDAGGEFEELVTLVNADIYPPTALEELERQGAVIRTRGGLKLIVRNYIPQGNPIEEFEMLARDGENLMEAVLQNFAIEDLAKRPNFHGNVIFDNVDEKDIPKLQRWIMKEGSAFLRKVEKYVSKFDLDIHPNPKKKGGKRIVLSAFSRSE